MLLSELHGGIRGVRAERRNFEIKTSPISKIKDFERVPKTLLFAYLIIKTTPRPNAENPQSGGALPFIAHTIYEGFLPNMETAIRSHTFRVKYIGELSGGKYIQWKGSLQKKQ